MRSMSTPETHCSGSFSISGYLTASHGITDLKCLWKFWRLFEAHPPWSSIRASANRMEQGGWCKRLWRKRSEMWPHECGQTRRLDWYCWVLWFAQNFSIYTNDAKKTTDSKKHAKEAGGVVTNVQLNVSLRSLSFCLDLIGPGLLPSCALQFSQVWQLTPWRPRQSECIQSLSKHPQWHCIILYYSVLFLFSER